MELVKYEKQYVVEGFDGKLNFIPENSYSAFKKALLTDKFVEVGGELINTSSIKRVFESLGESGLDKGQKIALEERKAAFKKALGRAPTKSEVGTLISKLSS